MDIDLKTFIRDVPDFPKPGILFKDITPLLRDGNAFTSSVEALARPYTDAGRVAGAAVEALEAVGIQRSEDGEQPGVIVEVVADETEEPSGASGVELREPIVVVDASPVSERIVVELEEFPSAGSSERLVNRNGDWRRSGS